MPVSIDLTGHGIPPDRHPGSLGRAQPERIAEAGAALLLLDHSSKSEAATFAATIAERHGVSCAYMMADFSDLKRLAGHLDRILVEHGNVVVLINNAVLIKNRLVTAHGGCSDIEE